jgi:hypothetical protein
LIIISEPKPICKRLIPFEWHKDAIKKWLKENPIVLGLDISNFVFFSNQNYLTSSIQKTTTMKVSFAENTNSPRMLYNSFLSKDHTLLGIFNFPSDCRTVRVTKVPLNLNLQNKNRNIFQNPSRQVYKSILFSYSDESDQLQMYNWHFYSELG